MRYLSLAIVALGVLSVTPRPASAATQEIKIAVVPVTPAKGAPSLKAQIPMVEKSLKMSATVLPYAAYAKAAKKVGIPAKDTNSPENGKNVGVAAGATHVLFIDSLKDTEQSGKKKKVTYYAKVNLIDILTGVVTLTKRYPLNGKKLTQDVADDIFNDVNSKLQPAPVRPTTHDAAPPPPPAAAPPPPEVENSNAVKAPPAAAASPAAKPAAEPVADANAVADAAPPDTAPSSIDAATGDAPAEGSEPPAAPLPPMHRPGLRITLGALGFDRVANVTAAGAASTATPCYCEPAKVSNPFFTGLVLRAEYYPMALINSDGSRLEGVGVHLALMTSHVTTLLTNSTTESNWVLKYDAGVMYRLVLWDSHLASDIQFRLGYSYMSYPLSLNSAFPGMSYKSPYLGILATFPLIEEISLMLGGHIKAPLSTGLDTLQFGTLKSGLGFHIEAGVRFNLDPIELGLTFTDDAYNTSFTGGTAFQGGSQVQYTNVSLSDNILGFMLSLGMAF